MRLLFLALCAVCCECSSQVAHGSIGVIYYTPEKIVVAAESRLTSGGADLVPTDDGCKIAAVAGKTVFISTGVTRHLPDRFSAAWDSSDLFRNAYLRVKAVDPRASGIAEAATKWGNAVADSINVDARQRPGLLRQFLMMLGPGSAITLAYVGGLDDENKLVLFFAKATPDVLGQLAEGSAQPVASCPDHGFCGMGNSRDLDIIREFANASSERAKRESAEWTPPKGALPTDYDALKTMRILEIAVHHHQGNDAGGPIDAVQLDRNGLLHWYARKANCPQD